MKRQKGFGQISLISIVALPFILIAMGLFGKASWDAWQEDRKEKAQLKNAIETQAEELRSFKRSILVQQQGLDTLEEQNDAILDASKNYTSTLAQLDLKKMASENPESIQEMFNVIIAEQIKELRLSSEKSSEPFKIDK